jgi:hypothetical protein
VVSEQWSVKNNNSANPVWVRAVGFFWTEWMHQPAMAAQPTPINTMSAHHPKTAM